jgi:hypothetical protein
MCWREAYHATRLIPEEMNKEREPDVTFISAEADEYIRTYIITRQLKGER